MISDFGFWILDFLESFESLIFNKEAALDKPIIRNPKSKIQN